MMTGKGCFEKFSQELSGLTDQELVQKFNEEVGNQGWATARASYLAAIHQEFNQRGFDYSDIGNKSELSFKNKIELMGKKVVVFNQQSL